MTTQTAIYGVCSVCLVGSYMRFNSVLWLFCVFFLCACLRPTANSLALAFPLVSVESSSAVPRTCLVCQELLRLCVHSWSARCFFGIINPVRGERLVGPSSAHPASRERPMKSTGGAVGTAWFALLPEKTYLVATVPTCSCAVWFIMSSCLSVRSAPGVRSPTDWPFLFRSRRRARGSWIPYYFFRDHEEDGRR